MTLPRQDGGRRKRSLICVISSLGAKRRRRQISWVWRCQSSSRSQTAIIRKSEEGRDSDYHIKSRQRCHVSSSLLRRRFFSSTLQPRLNHHNRRNRRLTKRSRRLTMQAREWRGGEERRKTSNLRLSPFPPCTSQPQPGRRGGRGFFRPSFPSVNVAGRKSTTAAAAAATATATAALFHICCVRRGGNPRRNNTTASGSEGGRSSGLSSGKLDFFAPGPGGAYYVNIPPSSPFLLSVRSVTDSSLPFFPILHLRTLVGYAHPISPFPPTSLLEMHHLFPKKREKNPLNAVKMPRTHRLFSVLPVVTEKRLKTMGWTVTILKPPSPRSSFKKSASLLKEVGRKGAQRMLLLPRFFWSVRLSFFVVPSLSFFTHQAVHLRIGDVVGFLRPYLKWTNKMSNDLRFRRRRRNKKKRVLSPPFCLSHSLIYTSALRGGGRQKMTTRAATAKNTESGERK